MGVFYWASPAGKAATFTGARSPKFTLAGSPRQNSELLPRRRKHVGETRYKRRTSAVRLNGGFDKWTFYTRAVADWVCTRKPWPLARSSGKMGAYTQRKACFRDHYERAAKPGGLAERAQCHAYSHGIDWRVLEAAGAFWRGSSISLWSMPSALNLYPAEKQI